MPRNASAPFSVIRSFTMAALGCLVLAGSQSRGPDIALDPTDTTPPKRMVTQGVSTKVVAANLTKCTRYPKLFDGARCIWTQNLVLDNVVIARKTVR